jgi:hypothetical protein
MGLLEKIPGPFDRRVSFWRSALRSLCVPARSERRNPVSKVPMRPFVALAILLWAGGCAGVTANTDCQWPADHQARVLDPSTGADRRHLADDAQTAEDLAIRRADASRTPDWQRNVAQYHHVREACRAQLNAAVAQQHAVPVDAVAAAVADRRDWLDALVIAAFASLFAGVAVVVTSSLFRGALAESRALAGVLLLTASLAAGAISVLAAGAISVLGSSVFIGLVESARIGNGHMSYRVERLPLRHRRLETFTAGAIGFMAIGAVQFRRKRAN